jgi:hypothetical protein
MLERDYYVDIDGEKVPNEEAMAAWLLDNNYLFLNSRKFIEEYGGKETIQPETLVLFLNCNDVFAWACADACEVTFSDLPRLFNMIRVDEKHGGTKFACIKRNLQPQKPLKDMMIKDGSWTEELDKLPHNS